VVPVNYFSPDELQTLISFIQDQHGLKLNRQQFTDISFDLFEDISGLEGVNPEQAMEIINTLWSIYCEHEP
jgi:5'-3' exonuclease